MHKETTIKHMFYTRNKTIHMFDYTTHTSSAPSTDLPSTPLVIGLFKSVKAVNTVVY